MDALIAAAIHDAKNGLTALNTWLAEAEREHPSAALGEARRVATRIGGQLVELLALYREAQGILRLAVDDHDLVDFCSDVVTELGQGGSAAVQLNTDFAAVASAGSWAFDDYQVKLVLLDALRNACRHARSHVQFSAVVDADGLGFTVSDDGNGFSAEILAGGEGLMREDGSGLGLRFARLIAARHATPNGRHGRVELGNGTNGGAVFRLRLP